MSSETNNINAPSLCANGCGFFGSSATNNLCSKCYNNQRIKAEQTASTKVAVEKLVNKVFNIPMVSSSSTETVVKDSLEAKTTSSRCLSCNKKVGVMGFKCKCGEMFCGSHRYPEEHGCEFDFKRTGKDAIAKANPVVRADKVNRI